MARKVGVGRKRRDWAGNRGILGATVGVYEQTFENIRKFRTPRRHQDTKKN